MKTALALWRRARRRLASDLRWKLTISHLAVALVTLVLLFLVLILIAFSLRGGETRGRALAYDPDFAQVTRLLAELLPPHLDAARENPTVLQALLVSLKQGSVPGSGPLGGTLNDETGIVVVADDGTILAASLTPEEPVGSTVQALEPSEWRSAFEAALAGSRDLSAAGPLVRVTDGGSRLVSAYPIVRADGTIIGAVGLRTRAVEPLSIAQLLLASVAAVGELILVASIPAVAVSLLASFLLTRGIRRQLGELERATEAIVRGDLGRRVFVSARDELGRLAERFNVLTAALEQLEAQRRSFFANVAHDLRTPLAAIRAQAETALEELAPGETVAQTRLRRIVEESDTLSRMVEDLFTLARLEERGLPLALRPVALAPLFADVVETLRPLARQAGHIGLVFAVSSGCPLVQADPLRLRQILVNLVHNALRHTPEGGVVRLSADVDPSGVVISVADTGPGFPEELVAHAFERYRSGGGGSGLGLAVVKQLVEAQGGRIWIARSDADGTVIRLVLPIAENAARLDCDSPSETVGRRS